MFLAMVVTPIAIFLAVDPGHLAFAYVDAGGHSLRMLVSGHGKPAVVFEAGGSPAFGGPLEAWQWVQPGVSNLTTTVAYDRAGIGLSAPGPRPRDARQVARELHAALQNAGVLPPCILVGHSFGGPMNRVFADMYPADVCGMILLDPTQEEFIAWNQSRDTNRTERLDEEWKEIQSSLDEASQSHVPAGIPVVLVTAMGPRVLPKFITEAQKEEMKTVRPMWLKYHEEWLEKIPGSRHIVTQDSGHVIPFDQPELVINIIRQMVEQKRSPQK